MLFGLHDAVWQVTNLFFGLWLIPMGFLVIQAKMPKVLGWILYLGGAGYMLAAFLTVLAPDMDSSVLNGLTVPATIGEFWIIGYLLFRHTEFSQ